MEQPDNNEIAQYDPMKWKHTRRMAYIGIIAGLFITAHLAIEGKLSENLTELLGFWGVVITGYITASTWRDGWGKK